MARNRDRAREYGRRYYAKNKDKLKVHKARWRKANPEKLAAIYSNQHYKQAYGITKQQFEELVVAQNNKCAICGEIGKLKQDHNHSTSQLRGALCDKCNLGLGHFKDSVETLEKAVVYLRSYDKQQGTDNGH